MIPLAIDLGAPPPLLSPEAMAEAERAERCSLASQSLKEALPVVLGRTQAGALKSRVSASLVAGIGQWRAEAGNLVLMGDSGAGKTSAAAYLVRRQGWLWATESDEGLSLARRIRWATARQIGTARREARMGDSCSQLEAWKRASLLVLDDLGQDSNREDLFDLVDHRYARQLPTITTTGLRLEDISARFGEELRRRLTTWKGQPCRMASDWGGGKK